MFDELPLMDLVRISPRSWFTYILLHTSATHRDRPLNLNEDYDNRHPSSKHTRHGQET